MSKISDEEAMTSTEMLAGEMKFINARRTAAHVMNPFKIPDKSLASVPLTDEKERFNQRLVGLAFSGGGIRSATFNLGVLQALAELRLLRMFDYLSTISGGGYIGAWLAAWIQRDGEIENVEKFLTPNRMVQSAADVGDATPDPNELAEPEPIRHLRSYSSYLAPRAGLFTADSWALIAIYLRNLFLNQLVLFPLVVGLVLLVLELAERATQSVTPEYQWWARCASGVLAVVAAAIVYFGLDECRRRSKPSTGSTQIGASHIGLAVIILLIVGMVLVCWPTFEKDTRELWHKQASGWNMQWLAEWDGTDEKEFHFGLCGLFIAVGSLLHSFAGNGFAWFRLLHVLVEWIPCPRERRKWLIQSLGFDPEQPIPASAFRAFTFVVSGLTAGAALGGLLYCLSNLIEVLSHGQARVSLTIVPPLFVLSIFVAECLQVGILGYQEEEAVREWWAAFTARLFMGAIAWAAVFTLIVLAPDWLVFCWNKRSDITGAAAFGWLVTTISTVTIAQGDKASGTKSAGWRDWVVAFGPFVFLAGWLIAISLGVRVAITWWFGPGADPTFTAMSKVVEHWLMLLASVICVGVSVVAGFWFVDVNLWSLHGMYTNRLARCYLGASRKKENEDRRGARVRSWEEKSRVTNSLTGFATDDDVLLAELGEKPKFLFGPFQKKEDRRYTGYTGPLHLFGGTLNLVSGEDLAWQERMAESFVFSPLACGSESTGYRPTPKTAGAARDEAPDPAVAPAVVVEQLVEVAEAPAPAADPAVVVEQLVEVAEPPAVVAEQLVEVAEAPAADPAPAPANATKAAIAAPAVTDGYGGNLSLGTVMAISGAAVTPNMGFYSSPAVTALLTAFNLRLGAWFGNPKKGEWQRRGPRSGWLHLVREMLGLTTDRSNYVYLSDGGHFDNLGVYELVRRQCRYIVCVDGGADPTHSCKELGDVIRKVRIDFGIRIEIDIDRLKLAKERTVRGHVAVGRIRYSDRFVDTTPFGKPEGNDKARDHDMDGYLFYLKPSYSGDEGPDLTNYRDLHPDFPHETTIDQFFNESQFESYRSLGYHVTRDVFRDVVLEDGKRDSSSRCGFESDSCPVDENQKGKCFARCEQPWRLPARILEALYKRFEPNLSNEYIAQYLSLNEEYIAIQETLRDNSELSELAKDLHDQAFENLRKNQPDAEPSTAMSTWSWQAERHLMLEMLTVAENAFLGLGLGQRQFESTNSGWVRVVDLWISTAAFDRNWQTIKSEFSAEFLQYVGRRKALMGKKNELGGVATDASAMLPVEPPPAVDGVAHRP